jgi:FkbM family methyltransferase
MSWLRPLVSGLRAAVSPPRNSLLPVAPMVPAVSDPRTGDDREHARRAILDKRVLQRTLPLRARTVAHRAAQPEAVRREQRFRNASPAYAAAIATPATPDHHLHAITLDSLPWWTPLLQPDDQPLVARALEHQDFPYRVIAQTRELAVGGTMIDIGANTGRMSIPRAILGDVSASYCAEPDPLNYRCLVRNVRDNSLTGLVLPDRVAIGSQDGVARFERTSTTGGHRVIDGDYRSRREVIEVELLRLDTWVERIGIDLQQLVFVKVDAQGSEVHVLRGAQAVLAHRQVTWQMEIDPQGLSFRGFAADDLYAIVRRHFTHFIDLGRRAKGERVRPIDDLARALDYLAGARTDVLLFTLDGEAPR